MPIVAIADDFLDAYASVPRSQQKKVREFTEKFKKDPTPASINYEKIYNVKDPRVRTVRIDQKYRAIILHPDEGDVYVLVWVDNHDEAMAWAENRTFDVNPYSGALQVFNVVEAEKAIPPKPARSKARGLFDNVDDEILLSLAVPKALLPSVRAVADKNGLQLLSAHLPSEAAEALIWLDEGIPVDEIRDLIASHPKKQIDTSDLARALEHPDSRRRFVTVTSEEDLASMLDAPLEKWRIFLHPSQERLVTKNFNGAARVLGGPGTGKTVVAMHRARHLAKTLCSDPIDRILFTTYTGNLAQNVEQNLANLCGEENERIEVVHLHAWAARFMRSQGVEFDIAINEELDQCWKEAALVTDKLEFDLGFLKQEWEQVVQAKGIEKRNDYLKVSRLGRGRTLSRPQRGIVWNIFEGYQKALKQRAKQEWLSVIQQTRRYLEKEKPRLPYRALIVDEAQDFNMEEWKLIRAIAPEGPNDLFLVGDAHQRIYGRKIALRNCGINIQGRSSALRINYRTTEQIRTWAMSMLQGIDVDDLDGMKRDEKGYISLLSGPVPEIHRNTSKKEEMESLGKRIKELLKDHRPEDICLVSRTNKMLRDDYQSVLKEIGVPYTILDKGKEDRGIRLASMHRVKGLEFPVMILAGLNSHVMPLQLKAVESDPTSLSEHEERERSLLFVAATRARDMLIVTCYGTPCPFLPAGKE
jgi:UvrD/REP helicase N-terminal domain/UvrD-like helicase C-terminal domain